MSYKKKNSGKWSGGIFLILVAAIILANQFGGFIQLGFWSLCVAAIAVVFLVENLISLSLAVIPIPLAALYYIFQAQLSLPLVPFWTLVLVTGLLVAGLYALLPRRFRNGNIITVEWSGRDSRNNYRNRRRNTEEGGSGTVIEVGGEDENNPYIHVKFGAISRYLHSDCLETAELECSCGSIEAYFDNAQLSPNGAEMLINCSLGSVEVYVPRDWRIVDNMNTTLGNCHVDGSLETSDANAPLLTIHGSLSLGNVEVKRI